MGEGRDVTIVGQSHFAHIPGRDFLGCCRCEQGTDVDGHVEDRESGVTLCCILRVVIEITHHHLQVALEESCTQGDEYQRTNHGCHTHRIIAGGDGEAHVAYKHDYDTGGYHLAKSELVGEDAADDGQEIHQGEEARENVGCHCGSESELCLQKQGKDGQHGVVAKTLTGIGQRQRIQSFRLSFKHNVVVLIV